MLPLFLALILAGCGLPYRIAIPIRVMGAEPAIQQAVDTWNTAAGRTIVLVAPGQWSVVKVHGYLKGHTVPPGAEAIGDFDPETQTIHYCDCLDADPNRLRVTLTHEIGHALGLPHNPDPASPMFWANQTTNLTPDAADIDKLEVK